MLLAGLMVLVPIALAVFAAIQLASSVSQLSYGTQQEYDDATQGVFELVRLAYLTAVLVAYGFLAPRVSFRWFDTFFQFIPVYGLIWQCRVAWRIAGLSLRDWPQRPDEPGGPPPGMGTWQASSPVGQPTPDRFG